MSRIVLNTRFSNSLLPLIKAAGFTDNFDRATGPIGVTSGQGKTWKTYSNGTAGDWRVTSTGTAAMSSGASRNYAVVDSYLTNGKLTVTAASLGSTRVGGIVARFRDIDNHLFVAQPSAAEGLVIYKRVAGTSTRLAESAYFPVNGDVYELELNGANLILKVNGSTKATATDAAFEGETLHGLYGTSTSVAMGWDTISFV